MQCPDCKRLRHVGECEPYMSDLDECEQDHLETLALDAEMARERYLREKEKIHERRC